MAAIQRPGRSTAPRIPRDRDAVAPLFIVEAWASRNPSVRWPLVIALILLLMGLAGGIAGPEEAAAFAALAWPADDLGGIDPVAAADIDSADTLPLQRWQQWLDDLAAQHALAVYVLVLLAVACAAALAVLA